MRNGSLAGHLAEDGDRGMGRILARKHDGGHTALPAGDPSDCNVRPGERGCDSERYEGDTEVQSHSGEQGRHGGQGAEHGANCVSRGVSQPAVGDGRPRLCDEQFVSRQQGAQGHGCCRGKSVVGRHNDVETFVPAGGAGERAGVAQAEGEESIELFPFDGAGRGVPAQGLNFDGKIRAPAAERGEVQGQAWARNRVTHAETKELGTALFEKTSMRLQLGGMGQNGVSFGQ